MDECCPILNGVVMLKKLFILAIMIILIFAAAGCRSSASGDPGADSPEGTGEAVTPQETAEGSPAESGNASNSSETDEAPSDDEGMIRLEGTIDGYMNIHMTIRIKDGMIEGKYYYDKFKIDIKLKGTIEENRMVTINEYDGEGNHGGTFKGLFVPGIRIDGTWSKPGSEETIGFDLTVIDGIPDNAVWAGEWTRFGSGRFGSSTLVIFNETADGFDFQIDAYDGHHLGPVNMGFISGTARIQGSAAAYYEDSGTEAQLVFIQKDGLIELTANDACNAQAGQGVTFGGDYTKDEIKETLLSSGYVQTEEQQKAFEELVGLDVELFLDTAQVSDNLTDLDGYGAKVYHWSVFGLERSHESAVMFLPDGKICAAVIEPVSRRILVYTDAEYIGDVPKTIKAWIDGLDITNVLFIKSSKW
jgi:hypothetical protein